MIDIRRLGGGAGPRCYGLSAVEWDSTTQYGLNHAVPDVEAEATSDLSCSDHPYFEACRLGDLTAAMEMCQRGELPERAILIGLLVESDPKGSVGLGVRDYLQRLVDTDIAQQRQVPVVPVLINTFYSNRLEPGIDRRAGVCSLVREDIRRLDGVVLPGDHFNFPAIELSDDPRQSVWDYQGERSAQLDRTIYGLSAEQFYEVAPDHHINPNPESLHYEAELISALKERDIVVIASCHGMQAYAVMQGAHMVNNIEGHDRLEPVPTPIEPRTMAHGYMGPMDCISKHSHTLGLDLDRIPDGLEVVGRCGDHVEIIEERYGKPFFGFQSHPEFTPKHPAIEAFVGSVIHRHQKQQMLMHLCSERHLS